MCVIIAIAGLLSAVSIIAGSNFITDYATDQSLQIMATALALNVATISFITGSLKSIEDRVQKPIFNGTRSELRHNVLAMAIVFIVNFAVVSGIGTSVSVYGMGLDDILSVFSTILTVFFGALIVEISMLILKE